MSMPDDVAARRETDPTELMTDLMQGELDVVGRIMPASNHTLLAVIDGVRVVYKPVRGEAPLWDFPDGTLAAREYAARLVSKATGWGIVPETVLRDGPFGPGMVQRWMEPPADDAPDAVDVVAAGARQPGWLHVFDAEDAAGRPVELVHLDDPGLRRMAIFDVVVNNTDRKGGHILRAEAGRWWGVDHGICFHHDDKLRTVLWGWAGSGLTDEESAVLRALLDDTDLADRLAELLAEHEIAALRRRTTRMLDAGRLPHPADDWPAIPWPPF